jgi:transcription-repair coupling factor (superfamily II helicase)
MSVYDEKVVKNVIEAELSRGGQVYYVHNRVQTIIETAANLKKMVSHARVGIVHGQLSASQIESAMYRFMHNELDVLVASTIIESGLDIPSAKLKKPRISALPSFISCGGALGGKNKKLTATSFFPREPSARMQANAYKRFMNFLSSARGFALRFAIPRFAAQAIYSAQSNTVLSKKSALSFSADC